MSRTFNTCADVKVSYQKTFLGCKNKFTASVTLDCGQVLLRTNIITPVDFKIPTSPVEKYDWHIQIMCNDKTISLVPLNTNLQSNILNIINKSSIKQDNFMANLTLADTAGKLNPVTLEQITSAFKDLAPIGIVFEVC